MLSTNDRRYRFSRVTHLRWLFRWWCGTHLRRWFLPWGIGRQLRNQLQFFWRQEQHGIHRDLSLRAAVRAREGRDDSREEKERLVGLQGNTETLFLLYL